MASVPIFSGSADFVPGMTSFGYFDNEYDFQVDAERFAIFAARQLGYPVLDVELSVNQLFDAYEIATIEYSNQVNTFLARDNFLNFLGAPTGSDFSNAFIKPTLQGIFKVAKEYGTAAGAGGTLNWYSGSITLTAGRQVYDFRTDAEFEKGDPSTDVFTIRQILHYDPPASDMIYDPLSGGLGMTQMLDQFGWSKMGVAASFLLVPLNYDVMRLQAVEFNQQIRRSAYSFHLTGTRIRIFPVPSSTKKLWFYYTLDDENVESDVSSSGRVTNHSNMPYGLLKYSYINSIGRQWIRKYALAVAKEMLGYIRSKYSSIPVPGEETSLNGSELIDAGRSEKEALLEELKETLEQMSKRGQLERKSEEAEFLAQQLAKVPLKIYTG